MNNDFTPTHSKCTPMHACLTTTFVNIGQSKSKSNFSNFSNSHLGTVLYVVRGKWDCVFLSGVTCLAIALKNRTKLKATGFSNDIYGRCYFFRFNTFTNYVDNTYCFHAGSLIFKFRYDWVESIYITVTLTSNRHDWNAVPS